MNGSLTSKLKAKTVAKHATSAKKTRQIRDIAEDLETTILELILVLSNVVDFTDQHTNVYFNVISKM